MLAITNILSILWSNPIGRMAAIIVAAFAFGFVRGYSFEHNNVIALKAKQSLEIAAAINGRDAYWKKTMDDANAKHEAEINDAIREAKTVPVAASRPELIKLCRDAKTGTDCRSK